MKEHEERNMKRFMRPYIQTGIILFGAAISLTPAMVNAQAGCERTTETQYTNRFGVAALGQMS